jgi:DEAD/DEAH box helicase domain-containing protein
MSYKNRLSEYIHAMAHSPTLAGKVVFHHVFQKIQPVYSKTTPSFSRKIKTMLNSKGLRTLFSHQEMAMDWLKKGHHTVVSTPTASGKSLIYNLPVIERILSDPSSCSLYLFPLKALAQDQLQRLESFFALIGGGTAKAAIYDGDTNAYQRKKIRSHPPNILLTNPDMLHASLLPFHLNWETFFLNLDFVIVDEVHSYRGAMGSHMGQVFRRLIRVCNYYKKAPLFVFTSATVANPEQLCRLLTDLSVVCVDKSGAPRGKRHLVFIDPKEDNPAQMTILLLKAALARKLRTIVYTKSRKYAELITLWVQHQAGRFASRISSYRAGFLPEERRRIETRLAEGDLLAVVTTSALELGIDIGDLDLCILVGYPGSIVSTWQRGGRVGRSGQDSAIVFVAAEDALDQFFLRNPNDLLTRSPESAVINPYNPQILRSHLECAAAELPLKVDDPLINGSTGKQAIRTLLKEGKLFIDAGGESYHCRKKYPHRYVNLRGTGVKYKLIIAETKKKIGEIDGVRAFRETHPGAIYLHQGRAYAVIDVALAEYTITIKQSKRGCHTRVRSDKNIQIIDVADSRTVFGALAYVGKVKVTEKITGYEEIQTRTGKILNYNELNLPPLIIDTEGCWFIFPDYIQKEILKKDLDIRGGLHAIEHAAIGILPLLVMMDRGDIGGFSTLFHNQTNGASIFIYDGIAGGIGTAQSVFKQAEILFKKSMTTIKSCECESGCPSCVHSPKCGSGNHPIDKSAAAWILNQTISVSPPKLKSIDVSPLKTQEFAQAPLPLSVSSKKSYFGVFDLETQRSALEVGGWQNADQMRISCAVLYDAGKDDFFEYVEGQVSQLIEHICRLELVVGFNLKRFDYKVLSHYADLDFSKLPTLDILQVISNQLGFRLSLDHLAGATLGFKKKADGLTALKWWQEGRISQIIDYCRKDVRITRDLYLFGKKNGYLLFRKKDNALMRVPVNW